MSEDSDSGDRQRLKTLQHSNNMETTTSLGKQKKCLNDYFQPARVKFITEKKRNFNKSTQVKLENILCEDLIGAASEKYWEVIAEKRRVALQVALEENEQLWLLKESFVKENTKLKTLLDEANSFVEVFKEVISDSNNDTGIEVGDVSQDDVNEQD